MFLLLHRPIHFNSDAEISLFSSWKPIFFHLEWRETVFEIECSFRNFFFSSKQAKPCFSEAVLSNKYVGNFSRKISVINVQRIYTHPSYFFKSQGLSGI